ncbi:MAG: histidinol-phosphate transaminase [Planctomycetota bacterium]
MPLDPGVLAAAPSRYPSAGSLEQRLADEHGVSPERVLVTAGADEAIDRLCRVCLTKGTHAIVATPTFEMIPRYIAMAGADTLGIPWGHGEPFPTRSFLDAVTPATAMAALVTPNNPTGVSIDRATVQSIASSVDVPLLLDLAYVEFEDDDRTDTALETPGVVATRTFSKAWGLASLRVGYAIGDAGLIERMRSAGGPFSVAGPSIAAVGSALDAKRAPLHERTAFIKQTRLTLEARLASFGLRVTRSAANFVFAWGTPAARLASFLATRGIVVRTWPDRDGLADAVRITVPDTGASAELLFAAIDAAAREGIMPA